MATTYPLAAVRQVSGYGVLSVRSTPLSVLAEGPVYSSVTFSASVHSPTVHHPSDLFPSRAATVYPDAKTTYAPESNKKQSELHYFSRPERDPLDRLSDDQASSYFHFASLHHHPSASLYSLQSYRAMSTSAASSSVRRSPSSLPSPIRFYSTLRREEEADELMGLASSVVTASGL
jgi:hypothetical protein